MPNETSPTQKTTGSPWARRILWGSHLLNVVLAITFLVVRGHAPHPLDIPPSTNTLSKQELSLPSGRARPHVAKVVETGRFQIWSSLESTNLLLYAENLRSVGCPEKTVCDIVVPALDRWMGDRFAEISLSQSIAGSNYWATGKRRREINAEFRRQGDNVRQARREIRKSLLCTDTNGFGIKSTREFLVFGFLADDRLAAMDQLLAKSKERIEIWEGKGWGSRGRTGVFREASDLQQIRAEKRAFDADLAKLLPVADFEELTVRSYSWDRDSFDQTNSPFGDLRISPGELRSLTMLRVKAEQFSIPMLNPYADLLDDEPPDSQSPLSVDDLTALLGPQRTAEFIRAIDPSYIEARELLTFHELPVELANAGYDLIQQSLPALKELRTIAGQDFSSARHAMQEIRRNVRQQWEAMLSGIPDEPRFAELKLWTEQALRRAWEQTGNQP